MWLVGGLRGDTPMKLCTRCALQRRHYLKILERLQAHQLWLPITYLTLVFACVTKACIADLLHLLTLQHCLSFATLERLQACSVACHCLCDSILLPVNSMPLLRSRLFKMLGIRAPISVLEVSPLKIPIRCIPNVNLPACLTYQSTKLMDK